MDIAIYPGNSIDRCLRIKYHLCLSSREKIFRPKYHFDIHYYELFGTFARNDQNFEQTNDCSACLAH